MILFFLRHAINHLNRERQRTLFVLFCIAAGVAAVVALRTLGLMMETALLSDLRAANRGDLAIDMPYSLRSGQVLTLDDGTQARVDLHLFNIREGGGTTAGLTLSSLGQARLSYWAQQHGCALQFYWSNGGPYTPLHTSGNAAADYVQVMAVDPQSYPFYSPVRLLQPPGETLSAALSSGPHPVVISTALAERLGLQVGAEITLSGVSRPFTVSGIVAQNAEARAPSVLGTSLFPFVYIPYESAVADFHQAPNNLFLRLPSGADPLAVRHDLLHAFPGLTVTTVADVREANKAFSEALTQLVTVMGLVSLLIGGIGIANTMNVVVSRRGQEIAVFKTLGLQAEQIIGMFVIEALLLGTLGSVLGLALGQGLVFVLKSFSAQFTNTALQVQVYGDAQGMGFALGVLVTLVFGFLPALAAARVRPNAVLHPQGGAALPAGGRLGSLLVLLLLAAVMGLMVGTILGNLAIGMVAAYATLIALGLAVLLLNGLVWLFCHLPAFGLAPLKLIQRALNTQRSRAATTMLALLIGSFALGAIWLFVQGTLNIVSPASAEQVLGGSILVTTQTRADAQLLERQMKHQEGIRSIAHDDTYSARVTAINDEEIDAVKERAIQRALAASYIGAEPQIEAFAQNFTLKTRQADTLPYRIAQGRDLDLQRADEIVLDEGMSAGGTYRWFQLKPGDRLTLQFSNGAKRTLRVAGIAPQSTSGGFVLSGLVGMRWTNGVVGPGAVPRGLETDPSVYLLSVPDASTNQVMDFLANRPGIYMVDIRQFDIYTQRMTSQFMPLPLMAAGLALFASSVIIANTVLLATIERRRQIAIMKAIGMQTESVLGLLLLENGLVGLAGGLLGTGLSLLLVLLSGALGERSSLSELGAGLPYATLAWLVLLALVLSLAATLLTGLPAAREKPLAVLRYE